ncbi:hypothetical protein DSM101010T_20870 [Desulfovibrio subterraneus]|uniref:Uncharacterized protein n=1 Tax=Desulfovibrio subterraneus TaxID=2718620 RepID=A0A7J0BKK7_9BACT|nr:hypothetical protein DSM101010T_20870 [Desulfovibrio subterraneus]
MALYHVTHPPSRDGKTVANHRVIPIRSQKVLEMLSARYNGRSGAWVVRSTEGLGCDLQEGDYLRLKVIASDEWFNLRRVFTFDYTKDMIATNNADYESGRSLEIRTK